MENKLKVLINGGLYIVNYISSGIKNQAEYQNGKTVSITDTGDDPDDAEVITIFNTDVCIPIIMPKFFGNSTVFDGKDLEIEIKFFGTATEITKNYANLCHRLLKGNKNYIDSKITLNFDATRVALIFTKDSVFVPEIYLLNKYANESFKDLLKGFDKA